MPIGGAIAAVVLRIAVSSFQGIIEANDLCLECRDAVAIRFQQSKTGASFDCMRLPKVLASMEKTPCMNDHIKQFLRFTSEDELIRLAEIGLAVEMHQRRKDSSMAGWTFPIRKRLPQNFKPTLNLIWAAHVA